MFLDRKTVDPAILTSRKFRKPDSCLGCVGVRLGDLIELRDHGQDNFAVRTSHSVNNFEIMEVPYMVRTI